MFLVFIYVQFVLCVYVGIDMFFQIYYVFDLLWLIVNFNVRVKVFRILSKLVVLFLFV